MDNWKNYTCSVELKKEDKEINIKDFFKNKLLEYKEDIEKFLQQEVHKLVNFKIGTVVTRKNGKVKMTINKKFVDATVECVWFSKKNKFYSRRFRIEDLKKITRIEKK